MIKIEYEMDIHYVKQLVEALDDWMLANQEDTNTLEILGFAEYLDDKIEVAEE